MEKQLESIADSFKRIAEALESISGNGIDVNLTLNMDTDLSISQCFDHVASAIDAIAGTPLLNIKKTDEGAIPIASIIGWGSEMNIKAQLSNDESYMGTVLPLIIHKDNED